MASNIRRRPGRRPGKRRVAERKNGNARKIPSDGLKMTNVNAQKAIADREQLLRRRSGSRCVREKRSSESAKSARDLLGNACRRVVLEKPQSETLVSGPRKNEPRRSELNERLVIELPVKGRRVSVLHRRLVLESGLTFTPRVGVPQHQSPQLVLQIRRMAPLGVRISLTSGLQRKAIPVQQQKMRIDLTIRLHGPNTKAQQDPFIVAPLLVLQIQQLLVVMIKDRTQQRMRQR
jgi:hypothetical protein